ncbi:MAG: flagellar biosynthesis protein FlhA, partial [Bacteroidetes bacterium]|nr:flagellar biosynthesis protein FlhA [Bacteroidota bacterium]
VTGINFIGGVIIGMVQSNLPFNEVLSLYSIATVGDGLVSQVPSILISTATGMIVTRAVSEGSMNDDVSAQFLAQPQAIMITGFVMAVLMLVPGMPKVQLAIMAVILVMSGHQLQQKVRHAAVKTEEIASTALVEDTEKPAKDEASYYRDVNNVYSLINIEPIEMEFGYSLIPLIDEGSGGKMINRIVIFRRQYAQDMGFVIPSVRLRDSSSLNTNQYLIKIRGEEVARGEILVDYYLALEPPTPSGEIDGIDTVEPAYGIPSKWIRPENKEMAEIYGYTVIDPLSVMLTHLSETVRQHAYELLGRQEVMQLLNNVKKQCAELVDELFPSQFSYSYFQKILNNLLKEGVSIKDMETILGAILDSISSTRDIDMITENIRIALKRTITRMFCEGGQMRVLTLDSDLEKNIINSMAKGDQGVYLALSPEVMQSVIGQLGDQIKKFSDLGQKPVILTSQVVRLHFYRLIEQFYPNVFVLSFNEIANNIQIQAVGNITI